jgi:excinuclease ABC subunit B
MANVIEKVQKPTLIISHNKTLAAQLFGEFKEFFPKNAVDYFVSYYDYYQPEAYLPATDTYIEKDASINEEINKFRHAATMHLLTRRDVIIVASVSCIYGLGSVAKYEALAITLKKGESFARDKLLRRLTDIQYTRSHMEFKQGMFHVLGDTVEIFLPGQDTIFRLEFFGDEIENIVEADSFTGEVIQELEEVTIFPAKHDVTTEDRIKAAINGIRLDLDLRVKELQKMGKHLEAERLKTRTEYDIEILLETGYCTGIENYTRYLNSREPGAPSETLINYFPDDFLLIIDESHMTVPQIGGMYNGNFSRKQTLVDFGFRLKAAFDNRPLRFEEFYAQIPSAIYISATPDNWEIEKSKNGIVEQLVRPTGIIDPRITVKPAEGEIPREP